MAISVPTVGGFATMDTSEWNDLFYFMNNAVTGNYWGLMVCIKDDRKICGRFPLNIDNRDRKRLDFAGHYLVGPIVGYVWVMF